MTVTIVNLKDELSNEWKTVKFTDETITNLKWNEISGLLFATTQTNIIWISSDKGETWRKQSELVEEAKKRYNYQLDDLAKEYARNRENVELQYHRTRNVFLDIMDEDIIADLKKVKLLHKLLGN